MTLSGTEPSRTMLAIFVLVVSLIAVPATPAQTENFGPIKYAPPKGFVKRAKDQSITFSSVDRRTRRFCFITLYAVSAGAGSARKDFAKEWTERVVKPWDAAENPETQTEPLNGWLVTTGNTEIYLSGNKAFASLTVFSGYGKSISVLGIYNDNTYLASLQSFTEGLEIDKTTK